MRRPAVSVAVLLAAIAGAALASGCSDRGSLPDTRSIPLTIDTIELRDAAVDFEENAAHADLHFVGVNASQVIHPGLPDACAADLVARFGSQTIEGTADPLSKKADLTLNGLARRYAERYNRLVLDHLRANGDAEARSVVARCGSAAPARTGLTPPAAHP